MVSIMGKKIYETLNFHLWEKQSSVHPQIYIYIYIYIQVSETAKWFLLAAHMLQFSSSKKWYYIGCA
jgi:hypothetical protein